MPSLTDNAMGKVQKQFDTADKNQQAQEKNAAWIIKESADVDKASGQYGGMRDKYGQAQQDYQSRGGPQMDWSQTQADRARAQQTRGDQAWLAQQYRDAIAGNGPSAAQAQLEAGRDAAVRQSMALAASARGGPAAQAAASRAGINAGNQATMQAANQAAILRAQEQQAAMQGAAALAAQQRAQDLQAQGLSVQQAQAQVQSELAAQGLNDDMTKVYLGAELGAAQGQAGLEMGQLQNATGFATGQSQLAVQDSQYQQQRKDAAFGGLTSAIGTGITMASLWSDRGAKTEIRPLTSDERAKQSIQPLVSDVRAKDARALVSGSIPAERVTGSAKKSSLTDAAAQLADARPAPLTSDELDRAEWEAEQRFLAERGALAIARENANRVQAGQMPRAAGVAYYPAQMAAGRELPGRLTSDVNGKQKINPLDTTAIFDAQNAGAAAGSAAGGELNNPWYEPPRAAAGPTPSGWTSYGDMWAAREAQPSGLNAAMAQAAGGPVDTGGAPPTIQQVAGPEAPAAGPAAWDWARGKDAGKAPAGGDLNKQFGKGGALEAGKVGVNPDTGKVEAASSKGMSTGTAIGLLGSTGLIGAQLGRYMSMSDANSKTGIQVLSDDRSKERETAGAPEMREFLDKLQPYAYEYKPEIGDPGQKYGVMAQDLQKSDVGSTMVERDPRTGLLAIDVTKGFGPVLAAEADMHKRIEALEAMVAKGRRGGAQKGRR